MMLVKRTFILFLGVFMSSGLWGQGLAQSEYRDSNRFRKYTPETVIQFRQDSFELDTTYEYNGRALRFLVDDICDALRNPDFRLDEIVVETSASPDGDPDYNEMLAVKRASALRRFLLDAVPVSPSQVKAYSVGADWEGMRRAVLASNSSYIGRVMSVIDKYEITYSATVNDERACLKELKQLEGGEVWKWLKKDIFPGLRQGSGSIRYFVTPVTPEAPVSTVDTLYIIHEYEKKDTVDINASVLKQLMEQSIQTKQDKGRYNGRDSLWRQPLLAFRTNILLGPGLNVGVEVPLGNRWSVAADFYYPWVPRDWMDGALSESKATCFQLLGGSVEARCWLGKEHAKGDDNRRYRLSGHSLGLVAVGGYYDFEYDSEGRQGEYVGLGLSYMYALPVGKAGVHFEFEACAGVIGTQWRGYNVYSGDSRLIGSYMDDFLVSPMPLRLSINLVVPIHSKTR